MNDIPAQIRQGVRPNDMDDLARFFDLAHEAADQIEADAARIAKLKAKVIAYGVAHADQWAKDHEFPNRHYHWQHYDDLEEAGARMDDFVRLGPEVVGHENGDA